MEEARNPTRAHLRLSGSDQGIPGLVGRGISTQDAFGTSILVIVVHSRSTDRYGHSKRQPLLNGDGSDVRKVPVL